MPRCDKLTSISGGYDGLSLHEGAEFFFFFFFLTVGTANLTWTCMTKNKLKFEIPCSRGYLLDQKCVDR